MSNSAACTEENKLKMSHKKWRALLKKKKRQARRQALAQERDAKNIQDVDHANQRSSTDEEERKVQEEYEINRQRQHELWLERERRAQHEWQAKKEWEEKERIKKVEEERKIKEEWEERLKKEREEEEMQKKEMEEKKAKQKALLDEATASEKGGEGSWHNPIAPAHYGNEKERDPCPFYVKVGACRFGDRCSRAHNIPESSPTLLFAGMYTHFSLDQGLLDEYDTDLTLEYEESDMYQNFRDFYEDVVPEFKAIGKVVQFKVCCNYEPHLRGNVYVQFADEQAAERAYCAFNGRWYAGRQITCQFSGVTQWKNAICGLFFRKRCPKGRSCNFMHVFRNPGNEFWEADKDMLPEQQERDRSRSERRRGRLRGRRSRSRSRGRRSRSHSRGRRSRSRSRGRRSRSHSRERTSRSRYRRSRSRSRSRRSRSPLRKRRSRSREKRGNSRRSGSRERRSRSKPQRSRSRGRSKSREFRASISRSRSLERGSSDTLEGDSSNKCQEKNQLPEMLPVLRTNSKSRSRSPDNSAVDVSRTVALQNKDTNGGLNFPNQDLPKTNTSREGSPSDSKDKVSNANMNCDFNKSHVTDSLLNFPAKDGNENMAMTTSPTDLDLSKSHKKKKKKKHKHHKKHHKSKHRKEAKEDKDSSSDESVTRDSIETETEEKSLDSVEYSNNC